MEKFFVLDNCQTQYLRKKLVNELEDSFGDKMSFTASDMKEAQKFMTFYVDKLEQQMQLFQYHLAEDVVLDWFGQTVKGEKKVAEFLKTTLAAVTHLLGSALPARKIGFRESHVIRVPRIPKVIPVGLMSPPRTFILKSQTKTPKKQCIPSTSSHRARRPSGETEGLEDVLPHRSPQFPTSPAKKMKTVTGHSVRGSVGSDCETVEEEQHPEMAQKLRYVVSEGAVEFRKPSSKKFQGETKWRRPCKLSVAYTATPAGEYVMYLIIYEGNVRCRRNLMKDFEAEEPEN